MTNLKYLVIFLFCFNIYSVDHDSMLQTAWDDFKSPVTTDAKYITMAGLSSSLLVIASKDLETYKKRESFDKARPFRDYGRIGEIIGWGFLNASYASYQYFSSLKHNNPYQRELANHMTKATLYPLFWTTLGKTIIHEKRPGYPDDDQSFPSGHSAASFAFASVIAARHGWYYGGASYLLAIFIAMSRINDDFHYLHDTLVGATIGAAYGWGTFYNYDEKKNTFWIPSPVNDGAKLEFVYLF